VRLVKRAAFKRQNAHRLWLDVLDFNVRARPGASPVRDRRIRGRRDAARLFTPRRPLCFGGNHVHARKRVPK
jgi:hypothetical protein